MATAIPMEVDSQVPKARQRSLNDVPTIVSRRLLLREFAPRDIRKMAGVAREHCKVDATADLYRPDDAEVARNWLGSPTASEYSMPLDWAVCANRDRRVIGYSGLTHIDPVRRQAQLRFWIGCGMTEDERFNLANAAECVEAVVDFAFHKLTFHRVYALQLTRQPRTEHILAGIDMNIEGFLRKRVHSRGVFEDIACWAITTDTWFARRRT
jgi:RimJ/RimL family protein N-acetyltransferase